MATILGLVLGAALLRLLPHPPNFAPIAAMALFAGAQLADRRVAFAAPLAAMLVSDALLGFHAAMPVVYACMAVSVGIGIAIRGRVGALTVGVGALASSVAFYLITNFAVWLFSGMYPLHAGGLLASYVAAIPFFHYTVLGDLFYAATLFGGFALLERGASMLRRPARA